MNFFGTFLKVRGSPNRDELNRTLVASQTISLIGKPGPEETIILLHNPWISFKIESKPRPTLATRKIEVSVSISVKCSWCLVRRGECYLFFSTCRHWRFSECDEQLPLCHCFCFLSLKNNTYTSWKTFLQRTSSDSRFELIGNFIHGAEYRFPFIVSVYWKP